MLQRTFNVLRHKPFIPQLVDKRRTFTSDVKYTNVGFWEHFGSLFNVGVVEMQGGLEAIHFGLGLPWWSSIIVGAACIRVAVLPARLLALRQQHIIEKARDSVKKSAQNNLLPLKIKLQNKVRQGRIQPTEASDKMKEVINNQLLAEMKNRKANPLQSLLPIMFNLPLIITFSSALRKMSAVPWPFFPANQDLELPIAGWDQGGVLFFTDLAQNSITLTSLVTLSSFATVHWLFCRKSPLKSLVGTKKMFYFALQGLNVVSFCILSLLPSVIFNLRLRVNFSLSLVNQPLHPLQQHSDIWGKFLFEKYSSQKLYE